MLLFLVLLTGCSGLPFSSIQESALLELYGTFHAMGITVSIANTDDPNKNAVANVEYRQGSEPYQAGFPLTRIGDTRFVGSLFWLEPGTVYDVRITFSDPDGDPLDNTIRQASASTRTEIKIPSANHSFIVSPSGNGTTCSLLSPCSLLEGISRARPGDEVVLRGGVYYQGEISVPRSGAPGAPIVIRGYSNEEAVLDGADPAPLTWAAAGAGVYATGTNVQEIGLVTANGARLYPYPDLASLQTLSWNIPGFYADGQSLYLHLAGNADPNNAVIVVSRYNRGFEVEKDYIYFLNLTFRHYGQGSEARAIYFKNASDNLVQDSNFAINNGGIAIREESHRNVIQTNEFYDTIFDWPWDAVKATGSLERGGVYFGGPLNGRGNVIRRNIFHDYFDGFDICPGEPPSSQTNETDVYDNLVYNMGDDGVQVDGWCSNIRLWDNTFHDVLVGISFAPTVGGPVYVLRNLIYRFGVGNNDYVGDSFKFNNSSSEKTGPIYLIHNTAVAVRPDSSGLELSSGSSNGWALIYARNNIWSGLNYALRNNDINHPVDLDYDNLWNGNNEDLVRWDSTKYATLTAFTAATGQEPHALNVIPGFASPQNGGYMLNSMSSLIDAGIIIPGINHDYAGLAPDIGAFESRAVYLPVVLKH
ncbi:MAG TPA: right-handed parallel beta-helix repeat-containing protein [Anaerolineae bacterium]|nr:right-handed parallel beta-helix repeat-containing protein [Anaerolineae bacterium]